MRKMNQWNVGQRSCWVTSAEFELAEKRTSREAIAQGALMVGRSFAKSWNMVMGGERHGLEMSLGGPRMRRSSLVTARMRTEDRTWGNCDVFGTFVKARYPNLVRTNSAACENHWADSRGSCDRRCSLPWSVLQIEHITSPDILPNDVLSKHPNEPN